MKKYVKFKNIQFLLLVLLSPILTSCMSCAQNPDDEYPSEYCGMWIIVSDEFHNKGEVSVLDDMNNKILNFKTTGQYESYYLDAITKTWKRHSAYQSKSWSFKEKDNTLYFDYEHYTVLSVSSDKLVLKKSATNDIFQIDTYRKLSDAEIKAMGLDNVEGGGEAPATIAGKYLHFYYDDEDRPETVIWQLNDNAASFEKGGYQIYYTPTSGPTYTYSRTGQWSAKYSITFRQWAFINGEQIVTQPGTANFDLTFYTNNNSRGTFVQSAASGSDTRKYTGRFFLGGEVGPGDWGLMVNGGSNGVTDDNSSTTTKVKTMEVSGITNITKSSATVNGKIIVEGQYTERGIVVYQFKNSMEAYAASLSTDAKTFLNDSKGKRYKVTKDEFSVNLTGLSSNTEYSIAAYVVYGDDVKKTSFSKFTTI